MIETLRIEQIAIVESAQLEFGPGLNAITGETGTGKSIVLGALSLLAGQRASAEAIREGASEGAVEAVFRTDSLPDLEAELSRRGFVVDEHALVVRRSLSRSGRSRAQVAGQLAPVSLLAELFAGRMEISSQHGSQGLLRPEFQGRMLDASAGLLDARARVADGHARLRALDAEIAALAASAEERTRRQDYLAFQLREIDATQLETGELARLRRERGRLHHAERLGSESAEAGALLSGDPAGSEAPGAADLVGQARRRVAGLAELDDSLREVAGRLESLEAELRDAAVALERYADGVEADPARLARAEERLHQLEGLCRKYGPSENEVLAQRDALAAELAAIEGADERGQGLGAERERLCAELAAAAADLSAGRASAALRLARAVEKRLRELAMPRARFAVALVPVGAPAGVPCGPAGAETAEFQFCANPGEPLNPLRKVASGGELSRLLLAAKNALRRTDAGMVLVFDEVDAGIGGRVADRVGRTLAELAAHHQVLCITHLPQIAAFADAHFRVEKAPRGGRTRARVVAVRGAERVEEIARMAGGESITEATRRHARELLGPRAQV